MLHRPEGPTADDLALTRRGLAASALSGMMFAAYAPAALGRSADPIVTSTDGLIVSEVTYPAPDGFALPAYVARPDGPGPHPVVIVASEIFGVHAYIQDVCRRLARSGYAAIAPAFFVRVQDPAPLSDMRAIQEIVRAAGYEQVMGDIEATLAWAATQPWADPDARGITGFCWGGKVVWQAVARFDAFDAGVAWYGRLAPDTEATPEQVAAGQPWPVDLASQLKAPVLGLYGENDRGIPLETVDQMRAALVVGGKADSSIHVYDGAQHGFHADYRPAYDAAAATDGWQRLLTLFDHALSAT